MHKPSIAQLVLKAIFPRPKAADPTSFCAHSQRNLVPEVRVETANFYGALDCIEAQYPGLDYTFGPHRRRLSRFPWHKKLFKAFDELGLTDQEILTLCSWEGTKFAKDRYERDAGRVIRDTTMDGVDALPPQGIPVAYLHHRDWQLEAQSTTAEQFLVEDGLTPSEDDLSEEDETDASVGLQLNQQLRAAAEARSRGEPAVLDEQFEQWMKEALERNDLSMDLMLTAMREGRPFPVTPRPNANAPPPPITSTNQAAITSMAVSGPPDSQMLSNDRLTMVGLYNMQSRVPETGVALSTVSATPNPRTEAAR